VLGALQVFKSELQPNDERIEIFDEMIVQLERVNHTVNDLLSYAKPTPPSFAQVNVVDIIQRTVALLSRQCARDGVKLNAEFKNSQIIMSADRKQFQQVLWNLVMNAHHAITDGGQIDIYADEEDQYVRIQISDNGRGIPPNEIGNVFKPFFTTKHKGTGLGMTISKRIIEQHNGTIALESEINKGTRVTIKMPKIQRVG
jgi:signal transduction histidine kinase